MIVFRCFDEQFGFSKDKVSEQISRLI